MRIRVGWTAAVILIALAGALVYSANAVSVRAMRLVESRTRQGLAASTPAAWSARPPARPTSITFDNPRLAALTFFPLLLTATGDVGKSSDPSLVGSSVVVWLRWSAWRWWLTGTDAPEVPVSPT